MLVDVTHSLAAILEVWTVAKNSWCAFFFKKKEKVNGQNHKTSTPVVEKQYHLKGFSVVVEMDFHNGTSRAYV